MGKDWHDRHRRKLSKKLHVELRAKQPEESLPVIIITKGGLPKYDNAVHRAVRELGGEIQHHLPIINGFATTLPGRSLAEIGPHKKVKKIHLDRTCRPCLDIAAPSVYADRALENGLTGRGVTVAILDSGIYPHADFTRPANRIVAWHDVVAGRTRPYDDNGHGTHVAGIAAGNGYASHGKYRGIAPEANLAVVKVADNEGSAPMSRVIAGLQWVLENKEKYGIRVVNLSLGSDPSESYRSDPLCQAVEKVWRAGVVVVVAAGNDGPVKGSIDTPGNDPLALTVGAMDDGRTVARGDDTVPDFSSRGPTNDGLRKPDLLAPGVGIVAPRPDGGYVGRSGTSMATPFVSGAAALLLAAEPGLAPGRVKRRLRESAEDRRLSAWVEGAGYLDAGKLLRLSADKTSIVPVPAPAAAKARRAPGVNPVMQNRMMTMAKRLLQSMMTRGIL